MTERKLDPTTEARWLKHVEKTEACWLWSAAVDSKGYGRMAMTGPPRWWTGAHRVGYRLFVGEIPDGLVLDHLCSNPRCVNPAHLEPVTQRENLLRSESTIIGKIARSPFPCGHTREGDHVATRGNGHRYCRPCSNLRQSERRAIRMTQHAPN